MFVLFILILSGLILVNLLFLLVNNIYGIEIASGLQLFDLLANSEFAGFIKLYVGVNHLVIFIICPLVFVYFFYKNKFWEYLSLRFVKPIFIILFFLVLMSLYPLMAYFTFLLSKIDLPDFLSGFDKDAIDTLTKLLAMDSLSDLVVNIIIIGILPGIGEEILFRGILQKEIYMRWRNHHAAIWVAAFLFSALHFQIVGFPAKFIIGLVLGYSYHHSGSLILPIILHVLNNSMATLSYFFSPSHTITDSPIAESIPILSVILSSCVFVALVYIIRKQSNIKPAYE
jgi:membrane protease YdiL (CAAX protease family)